MGTGLLEKSASTSRFAQAASGTFRKVAQGTEIQFLSQVFDGAVIILSLAPMVASTVANGPRSPWDAISLIIMLRIWRVKRVIDGEWSRKSQQSWQGGSWCYRAWSYQLREERDHMIWGGREG